MCSSAHHIIMYTSVACPLTDQIPFSHFGGMLSSLPKDIKALLLNLLGVEAFVSLRATSTAFWEASKQCREQLRLVQARKDRANREELLYLAKLMKQSGDAGKLFDCALRLAYIPELSYQEAEIVEEAFSLSACLPVGQWKKFQQELSTLAEGSKERMWLEKHCRRIQQEALEKRREVIQMISTHLIPFNQECSETRVRFVKLLADQYRHVSFLDLADKQAPTLADKFYREAELIAFDEICPTHPLRLGLALNHAHFEYERGNVDTACRIAKLGFDESMAGLDCCGSGYGEATCVMQIIRDALVVWTKDAPPLDASGTVELDESQSFDQADGPQPLLNLLQASCELWKSQ